MSNKKYRKVTKQGGIVSVCGDCGEELVCFAPEAERTAAVAIKEKASVWMIKCLRDARNIVKKGR